MPLSAAIEGGQLEAAAALLAAGAQLGSVPPPPGFFVGQPSCERCWAAPPLGLADKRRQPALVRLLLERGADPSQLWQESPSSWWRPLTAAVQAQGTCCESRAQQVAAAEILRALLAAGADPNAAPPPGTWGFKLLHGGDFGPDFDCCLLEVALLEVGGD